MPCLLSEEAELLLNAILQKVGSGDGWAFVSVPNGVKNRKAASEELERNGYISSVTLAGREYVQCTLTTLGRIYFENKPRMQIREAMEMFIPLPRELKEKLKQITNEYKDNDYIQDNPTAASIIDELKDAGYLKKFKKYLRNSYSVKFSYEDLNYDFLEEQYNRQFTSGNNITVHGGVNQLNAASGNATLIVTNNAGADLAQLADLIGRVKAAATDITGEDAETLSESLEVIEEETRSDKPKKSLLKMALTGIQTLKGSAEFAAAVTALIHFVQPFLS